LKQMVIFEICIEYAAPRQASLRRGLSLFDPDDFLPASRPRDLTEEGCL